MCSRLEVKTSVEAEGPEDPNSIAATNRFVVKLFGLSKFDEAEEYLQANLKIGREALGEAHPIVQQTMRVLVGMLRQRKRFDEAHSILRRISELEKLSNGSDQSWEFFFEASLCQIHYDKGEFVEAEKLARSTLDTMSTSTDEPSNAQCRRQEIAFFLSESLTAQERHTEAEDMLRREISLAQRILGVIDPGTRLFIDSLGWCLYWQEKPESVEVFKMLVDYERQVYYDGHPDSLQSVNSLNRALKKFGSSEQANEGDEGEEEQCVKQDDLKNDQD